MNEGVCDLGYVIQAMKMKGSIQLEYKEAAGQGMRSIDVSGLIDDERFMIGQLIVEEEEGRGYIVRETTRWMDLKGNICDEITEGCENCKLEDLEVMMDYDGWGELMSDGGWVLNEG